MAQELYNSKWNEPSMHCQAENLSPYVRHGRMFHVIQVYPGCWSPPIQKNIEKKHVIYASFTHCHIILYSHTRVYDSVNIWTHTHTHICLQLYIYICIYLCTTTAWSYGVCLTMNPFESLCGLRTYETERIRNEHSTKHDSASLLQ